MIISGQFYFPGDYLTFAVSASLCLLLIHVNFELFMKTPETVLKISCIPTVPGKVDVFSEYSFPYFLSEGNAV